MFVHYLGIPVSNDVLSPDYHVPRNTSGIAHKPGGDLAIALGGWRYDDPAGCQPNPTVALNANQVYCNDHLGTALNQAGTLMHELGHNGRLGHGGLDNSINCKPNYISVMNYSFQVRGLPRKGGFFDGAFDVNYSKGGLPDLNELSLSESAGLGSSDYATRWYGPPSPTDQLIDLGGAGSRYAKRHCDGSPVGA